MAKIELKIGDKTYNRKWVDDISSTSQISTDPAGINYGVIPSTGNAKLRDVDGEIRADIENGVLPVSNAATSVIINGNQVQEHITSDSDYDVINRELDLQFSDRLSLLDSVTYAGMPLRDYPMTAYGMLDDVIGSYGGYCREKVYNWTKYQGASSISFNADNSISVHTGSGWEIAGTPIKVVANKEYTIQYSIRTNNSYTTLASLNASGIPIQILRSEPTNTDCKKIAIATTYLSNSASTNIGTISFTPTTSVVYFCINFGWASDDQDIMVEVNTIKVDGNSLSNATSKYYERKPAVDGSYLVGHSDTISEHLSQIIVPYPYLPKASYRETIEKFCTLGQLNCSLNSDGEFEFFCAKPLIRADDTIVTVPNNYKIANLNKTLFLKNKVDGIDIKQKKVIVETNVGDPVYSNEYSAPDSEKSATGGANNSIFTSDSSLGCAFNTMDRGQSGSNSYQVYAGIDSSWGTYRINIPKHSADNIEQVLAVWTGVDNSKNPYTTFSTIYELTQQGFDFRTNKNATSAPTNFEWIGYPSESSHNDALHKVSHIATNSSHTSLTCTISITDEQKISGMSVTETDDYYTFDVCLQQSTKWYNAESNWSDSLNYSIGNGTLYSANVSAIAITVNGIKKVVTFEDGDLSSKNIESAATPVSIQNNELMQQEAAVTAIRDSILDDYKSGVPTASIDLFCGLKNWENGDIIQPNDVLTIEGEDGYWRVTGRTFKYNGSPTLSLELQKQKTKGWHYLTGYINSGTISTDNFTADGKKTGTITLPKEDYSAHTTGFIVTVNFNINGNTKTVSRAGFNSVEVSQYNALAVRTCHCYISANWSTGTISYSADEQYKKSGIIISKSYVESITIDKIEQFY